VHSLVCSSSVNFKMHVATIKTKKNLSFHLPSYPLLSHTVSYQSHQEQEQEESSSSSTSPPSSSSYYLLTHISFFLKESTFMRSPCNLCVCACMYVCCNISANWHIFNKFGMETDHKHSIYSAWHTVYQSAVANMAVARNFDFACNIFNADKF
jgi:hypothetical protein